MKTDQSIYLSVYINKNEIVTATDFRFDAAKETMIRLMKERFDWQHDEGLIFRCEKPGQNEVLFNMRAFLNQEPEVFQEPTKKNDHVKIFFSCPTCSCNEGEFKFDDDADIIVECKKCQTPTFVK